jgi:hypothetical protein
MKAALAYTDRQAFGGEMGERLAEGRETGTVPALEGLKAKARSGGMAAVEDVLSKLVQDGFCDGADGWFGDGKHDLRPGIDASSVSSPFN